MVKIMENPIKMDDLGVPLFLETAILTKNGPKHEDLGKGGKEANTSSLAPTVSSRDI